MTFGGTSAPPAQRHSHRAGLWLALVAVLLAGLIAAWLWQRHQERRVVRLGILHALTGPMAISEKPMVEAEQLAIEEINAGGGVLGRRVEAVVADTVSNPDIAARAVEQLLTRNSVSAIVGCWTSACRKTVKPIVERHNALFIYPMAYEGLEISPNIIYTGAAPNQQVLPAVNWSFEHLGKRFFLVGSDYVWPHSVNAIITDQLKALGGEVVGEAYIPFGGLDPEDIIRKIRQARPDVILSTLVGTSNAPFYRGLKEAGLSPKQAPVVSFSISETEVQTLPYSDIAGHYSAWCYFQSIDREENQRFIQNFRDRYGARRVISDVMEAAYFSVRFWARGAERANSLEPEEVSSSLLGLSYNAPEGIVTVDPSTRHTWRSFNMGQIREDGGIEIVWSADYPIRPVPYPRSRAMKDWDGFLDNLYRQWNNSWVNLSASSKRPEPP
ncbi:MAG: urea ABC transporter substrate-binding protein [Methylococcaceae bacterium]|nr:urea ABC transporter substrate-binding protein [Methylococcaceae bacterium]